MPTSRARKPQRRTTSQSPRPGAATHESNTDVPDIESLQNQLCDNCHVGVLQVIRYDPDSLHEVGQDLSAENQQTSGGAYETACGFCGQRLSHPLNITNGEGGA